METINDKINREVAKQADSDEQAQRIKDLFARMPPLPPSLDAPTINMHSLTIALCAAAFCVGKQPMEVPIGKVRTNSVSIANNLFHPDGTFIE